MGQSEYLTIRGSIRLIYVNEGLRGFYKGIMSPLVSRTPISSALYFS
ncbi:MAG: MC/SLC25 family protein [bacterium]